MITEQIIWYEMNMDQLLLAKLAADQIVCMKQTGTTVFRPFLRTVSRSNPVQSPLAQFLYYPLQEHFPTCA
jgi:hypothetical protein